MSDQERGSIVLGVLVSLWVIFAIAEWFFAAGYRKSPRTGRWIRHLSLISVGALIVALMLPGGAIAAALWAQTESVGLFNYVALPPLWVYLLTWIIYDLMIYLQHRAFHAVPFLWRLHAVHHCDTSLDLSSGIRFHPVEIVLSMLFKVFVAVGLGAPPEAIAVYELILTGMALFNHADFRLPNGLERVLRWFVVTPPMHRIHHSDRRVETDSNYGNALSLWDRLLGTYRDKPMAPLNIGLARWRTDGDQKLTRLLGLPFREDW